MALGSLIVMMTDFGTENWFDAAMKGEILRRAPDARILDLTHQVPRHSIQQGAFLLHCAVDSFPRQTIFVCVVDPGVGSERRSLVGWVGEFGFVGPDNGLITPLLDRCNGAMELHEIKSTIFRNTNVSATFHGRDLFAPAAARLYLGDDPRMAGPRVLDPVRLAPLKPREENGSIIGTVQLIDHFGNAITNIDQSVLGERLGQSQFEVNVGTLRLNRIEETYRGKTEGEPLCYWGSSRYLEIAVNFGSAADTYLIKPGQPVTITFKT